MVIVGLFIPRCLVGDRARYFNSQRLNDAIDDVTRLMQGLMSYGRIYAMLYDYQCILRFVQFGEELARLAGRQWETGEAVAVIHMDTFGHAIG